MKRYSFLSAIALFIPIFFAFAQPQGEKLQHISLKIANPKIQLRPGETGEVKITANIDEYWYTYGLVPKVNKLGIGPQATEITVAPKNIVSLDGKPRSSKPIVKYDEGFEMNIEIFKHTAEFFLPIKANATLKAGEYKAQAIVYAQVCDTVRCLPGAEEKLNFTLVIAGEPVQGATMETPSNDKNAGQTQPVVKDEKMTTAPATVGTTESQTEINKKKKEGVWSFLWFAMGAGATALLTPCVFPMIPITVSFFTKRAEKTKGKGLRDSLVYALGIILTFSALGFILAITLGSTGIGDFAANPIVNLAIATLFLVFALNLFGAFEIQVPTSIMNKLNNASRGDGIGSVLLMGLTFSLTSFTCTVPFVGSALISASGGEWFYPIIGMLGFSAVFAAPFFLLALFPTAMSLLPKSGGWMNSVKVVMGFLEIAAAMKFISNADLVWSWGVLSREVFLAIWIACGFLITLYILGNFQLSHDSPVQRIGGVRAMFAVVFASATFFLMSGMFGKPLGELDAYLPPVNYQDLVSAAKGGAISATPVSNTNGKAAENDHASWITSYEKGLEEAKRTGKPVFVDFTGFTCTNCRWMEANVFNMPEVQELFGKTVKVQLYTDRREEPYISNKNLQLTKFGSIELPLYAIISPSGEILGTKTFTRNKQEFIDFLKKGTAQ